MQPRICVITGATSGIGRQTALQLAKKDFSIQIVGRDVEKCKKVLAEVEEIFPGGGHQYFVANLSDLGDVRMLANVITKNLDHIDVLINNAGGVFAKRGLTKEGNEMTFATNHLAPFLLTKRLMPLILKGDKPRIVNVASDSHYSGKIDFDDLSGEKRYFVMSAYAHSKLANVLFSSELARRYKDKGVVSNSLHPGVVKTQIGTKGTNTIFGAVWNLFAYLKGISEEEGARTSVYLASDPEAGNFTGKYFDLSKEKRPSRLGRDEELAKKLWEKSEELVGEKFD